MFDFVALNRRQRIIPRNRTERLSDMLDWKSLGIYYRRSRMRALARAFQDIDEDEDAPKLPSRWTIIFLMGLNYGWVNSLLRLSEQKQFSEEALSLFLVQRPSNFFTNKNFVECCNKFFPLKIQF